MPVTDTIIEESFDGNGSTTTPYPITIPRALDEDIKLKVDNVLTTAFTIAVDGIRTDVAVLTGTTVVAFRDTPLSQDQPFPSNTTPAAEDVRAGLDKVTLITQEISASTDKSLKAGPGETAPLGTVVKAADTAMGQDATGTMVNRTASEQIAFLNLPASVIDRPNKTWADDAARALAVPDYTGQDGTQIDTSRDYTSTGTTAGDWTLKVGHVRYDEAQTLTDAQVRQANTNLKSVFTFNVKHYGATGDGSTDDTVACQAALDAAATTQGTAFFPDGTYILSKTNQTGISLEDKHSLNIPKGVTVMGESRTGSILKLADTCPSDTPVLLAYGGAEASQDNEADNITISNITIDGNKTARGVGYGSEDEGINIKQGKYLTIQNVTVHDCAADGIDIDDCSWVVVDNCHVYDCEGNGLHNPGNPSPAGNGNMGPVKVSNSLFERCGFERSAATNPAGGMDLVGAQDIQVVNCEFRDNAYEITMTTGTLMVSNCRFFHTADDGAGTDYPCLNLYSDMAQFDNCQINWSVNTCVEINGASGDGRISFTNNYFQHSGVGATKTAIEATDAAKLTIANNHFFNCLNCVHLVATNSAPIITGNQFLSCGTGLRVAASAGGIASSNFVNSGTGIFFESSSGTGWTISNNSFKTGYGMRCDAGSGHYVSGNQFGIVLHKSSATASRYTNNTISSLDVKNSASNEWELNNIAAITAASDAYVDNQLWRNNTGAGVTDLVQGSVTLIAGTVTVTTKAAAAAMKVRLYREAVNSSTALGEIQIGTIVANTSFVIDSKQLSTPGSVETGDLSDIRWEIVPE